MTCLTNGRARRLLAITAARMFDGAAMLPDPVVVIEGGRIQAVTSGPSAVVPEEADLVELPGATLMPGLIDTHVHLAFDAGRTPVDSLAARDDDAALEAMAVAATAQLRA